MIKKLSVFALAACLTMPAVAMASLEDRVEELEEQLEEKGEGWDLASRIQWSGDIRNRIDSHKVDTAEHYSATNIAGMAAEFIDNPGNLVGLFDGSDAGPLSLASEQRIGEFMAAQRITAPATFQHVGGIMAQMTAAERKGLADGQLSPTITNAQSWENETNYTTRVRLNMRVKATENIEVKARFVSYKTWGMSSMPNGETNEDGDHDVSSPYFLNSRSFDGTSGRQPVDNILRVDRAFMNWNNIAGQPLWFSIGRRPTTDGPPAHLRMGSDKRMATPINYMDYPFDGISLGYAYALPMNMDGSGRIRFCYGRGYEAGSLVEDSGMNDVDFAGLSWDVMKSGDRFVNLQSFAALNIFNVPGDTVFPNPYEIAAAAYANVDPELSGMNSNEYLDRMNMGNIYHTSAVYMDKLADFNYFVTGGWSRSDANGTDEMGTSLLGDSWAEPSTKDGYGFYVGGRYDIDSLGLKLGLEYNWGSKNWLAFTPGHDDMYSSKLYTRGQVVEAYLVYDLPGGEAISKFGKAFMRLGYQHYDYEYTYSGMWLGTPHKIDDLKNDPNMAQFYTPIESMDQIYLTLEAYF